MPQFEYRAIDLGDLPPRTDEVMLLNAAGADGWELVAVTSNNIAYLRRQIEDPKGGLPADAGRAGHAPGRCHRD
jgi:hypothetical protein